MRLIALLLLFVGLTAPALAQRPAPSAAAPSAAAEALPPAWLVRDRDTEILLFPTVHALPEGSRWLAPHIARRFDEADTLIVETRLPEDPATLAPMVAAAGIDPGLPPLSERLPEALYAKVVDAAGRLGLPMPALDRMQLWLISTSFSQAALSAVGIEARHGVEPALLARAERAGKALVVLETPQEQLGFFAGLSPGDQQIMLEATLADLANTRAEVDGLLKLWRQGDMDGIVRDFAGEAGASPSLNETLLAGRNRRWAAFLAGRMASPGRLFVAVGAAHFGGPDGLLALLAARGLRPVLFQPPPPPRSRRAAPAARSRTSPPALAFPAVLP
jgi:uncharacterized protein YbaP (TraB family)